MTVLTSRRKLETLNTMAALRILIENIVLEGIVGLVAKEKKSIIIEDVLKDSNYKEKVRRTISVL